MLIDCPACDRSYHVSREELGAAGRVVICPRCRTEWLVDGEGAAAEPLEAMAVSRRIGPVVAPLPRRSFVQAMRPFIAAGCAMMMLAGAIGARERLVRAVPRLAQLYAVAGLPVNVRGLEFARIATSRVEPQQLAVSGEIRNIAERRIALPRLVYEVQDAAGAPLARWSETVPVRALAAGQTLPFIAAPHDVPQNAATLRVHFES